MNTIYGTIFKVVVLAILTLSLVACKSDEEIIDDPIESPYVNVWSCVDETCTLLETIGGYTTRYDIAMDTFQINIVNSFDGIIGRATYNYTNTELSLNIGGTSYLCIPDQLSSCDFDLSQEQQRHIEYSIERINEYIISDNFPKTN